MFWLWMVASVLMVDAANDKKLMHTEHCNMFYAVNYCPPGEHFNARRGVCDLIDKVNCKPTNNTTPKSVNGNLVPAFPYPNSCEKYYRVGLCPEDFYFNSASSECDYPKSKGCPNGCENLLTEPDVMAKPQTCTSGRSKFGDVCRFVCKKPKQATGSTRLTCTESGWKSEGEDVYSTPKCVEPVAVIQNVLSDMAEEIEDTDAAILFIMDESGSVTAMNFEKEKRFMKGVIARFPLSENRSAGVILFSDKTRTTVSVNTRKSCSFFKQVNEMSYEGGGTNIRLALEAARGELFKSHHDKKLVVLFTDGQSPNATAAAKALKDGGAVIFTFGVTGYDEIALKSIASTSSKKPSKTFFYGGDRFEALKDMAEYLEAAYIRNATKECQRQANRDSPGA